MKPRKRRFPAIFAGLLAPALVLVGRHYLGTAEALGRPPGGTAATGPTGGPLLVVAAVVLIGALAWMLARAGQKKQRRQLAQERDRHREMGLRLRAELERSELRFRQLLDNAGDAIFFIDPDTGKLLDANRQAEELLGYSTEEMTTLTPEALFSPRERRRYLSLLRKIRRSRYAEEQNLRFRCKDGHLFTGAVHARLGLLGENQLVHGVLRDVTEVRRIERELLQKNRDLTLANEIAHLAAVTRDLDGLLRSVLAKIVETMDADGGGIYLFRGEGDLLQLAAHQGIGEEILQEIDSMLPGAGLAGRIAVSGRPRSSMNLKEDRRLFSQAVRQAGWQGFQGIPLMAQEKTIGVYFLFNHAKRIFSREELHSLLAIGKQVGLALEGVQLFEALQWQHRLTRASNRELERSRRLLRENLDQMEESNRALERLDRMKSNFLALASHELRTPLTYVLSGSELLVSTMGERLSGEEHQMLDAIYQGGKRLERIVQDLLEVAQIESQSLYLAREKIDLPALMDELVQEYRPILEKRHLSFRVADFPSPLELLGDGYHLRRAFERLLENAVKFTPEGGLIEIRTAIRAPSDVRRLEPALRPFSPTFFQTLTAVPLLQMTVQDSGVGIDPEDQVQVFDKFYSVGEITHHFTSRTRFGGKGVGLGLTLVKGMVEAHGGMVWVESRGTKGGQTGSAFHILLPLSTREEQSEDLEQRAVTRNA